MLTNEGSSAPFSGVASARIDYPRVLAVAHGTGSLFEILFLNKSAIGEEFGIDLRARVCAPAGEGKLWSCGPAKIKNFSLL
jgi:hypothetical protein